MASAPGTPTLDQLNVLIHVVEAGSFAGAAREMNRAISVVSYTIGNLEAQLGMELFDRTTHRRSRLTQAGRMVLAEARQIVGGIDTLRAKVAGMTQGLEGELDVVLDCLLPPARILDALTAFAVEYPTVTLNLHMETLGAVADLVLGGAATIGISGPFTAALDELTRIGVGSIRMVPVAAPAHPLVAGGRQRSGAAREHVQLVVYDRSGRTEGQDFSVSARRTWRLADLDAKHMLLKAGLGWGMMPLARVEGDISAGDLALLDIPDLAPFDYPIDAIHRTDTPPGPAAEWLIERFGTQDSG